ncbi:MAG: AIR synthase-related protein [Eubacteriales bacterium]|nr:AIR synthase-related protein [Eubacteriales bacterium]
MELRYGRIDENVRKRSVLDVFLREGIDVKTGLREDSPAAVPITLCRTKAGEMAVISAANRLAGKGMQPEVFCPVLLFPPGTEEETLRVLIRQIGRTALSLDVRTAEAHAEVSDAVTRPLVTGVMSGVFYPEAAFLKEQDSKKNNSLAESTARMERFAGMEIVIAGFAGFGGTYMLACDMETCLRERFHSSLLERIMAGKEELCCLCAARTAAAAGAAQMVSLSDGGVLAGLWELSLRTGCGMDVDFRAIPLLQEIIEISEYFGIDPYCLQSEGALLIAAKDGARIVQALAAADLFSARIGHLTKSGDRILRNGEDLRYLDRPGADSLTALSHAHNHKYD